MMTRLPRVKARERAGNGMFLNSDVISMEKRIMKATDKVKYFFPKHIAQIAGIASLRALKIQGTISFAKKLG
jgi:hypothetical protein